MTARIRRNDNVRVIDRNSAHVGRVGVVVSISRARKEYSVRLCMRSDAPEVVATFDFDSLQLDREVSATQLDALLKRRDELKAAHDAQQVEYEARRKQRELEAYREQRAQVVAPMVREQRESVVVFGQARGNYTSDRITIYTRQASFQRYTPNVQVNWSALGSVSPEEALAFAQALAAAAVEAMAIRDQQERALGIEL